MARKKTQLARGFKHIAYGRKGKLNIYISIACTAETRRRYINF
jgi:hypothetical protein